MEKLEFYTFNNELWYRTDKKNERLTEDSEVVDEMICRIADMYPDAIQALNKEYGNKIEDIKYLKYRIVVRFCKCNFGCIDDVYDVSSEGSFTFEHVSCPLRGECKLENIVCHPRFNSHISKAEMRVLELLYKGCDRPSIADKLFLSEATVHNHIRNAFTRINVHSTAEFIEYANRNNLFDHERIEY